MVLCQEYNDANQCHGVQQTTDDLFDYDPFHCRSLFELSQRQLPPRAQQALRKFLRNRRGADESKTANGVSASAAAHPIHKAIQKTACGKNAAILRKYPEKTQTLPSSGFTISVPLSL